MVVAADGAMGLRVFRAASVALVICDLFMPERDGFEVLRELRRLSADVRVITVSGGGFEGTVDLLPVAKQLGAAEVIEKPFTPRALLHAVASVLGPSPDES